MRCKACNKIQTAEEAKLYDDFCRQCAEIAARPDEDHIDQGLDSVYFDEGWEKDDQ